MAQHLRYPAGDGSPSDLPPSESHLLKTEAAERRFAELKKTLCRAGFDSAFDPTPGEYVLVEQASGLRLTDVARLCVAHVRSGRPKLESVVRVVMKKNHER